MWVRSWSKTHHLSDLEFSLWGTCLSLFLQEKGKYRISLCWITAGDEVHMLCFYLFPPPPELMQFFFLVSAVVLCGTHTWPQQWPWRHSQVYKFTQSLWDALIRSQIPKQLWKRWTPQIKHWFITSISCHLRKIFTIWGPFMRKVMADWHQMCHKLSAERCQAK